MPEISFFIDEHDVCLLLDRLNSDREIAFIVSDGPTTPVPAEDSVFDPNLAPPGTRMFGLGKSAGRPDRSVAIAGMARDAGVQRWKAVQTVDDLKDGRHSLWHVPAGPLPLVGGQHSGVVKLPYPPIPDPWAGWTGPPGFGPGCHPWVRLNLWTRHRPYTPQERNALHELNAFWMAEHDMLVVSGFEWTGSHFSPAPPQTKRWWNRMRGWVDRTAVRLHAHSGFRAFPSALHKLKDGMRYYSRNFDLGEGIRTAENPRSK